MSKINAQAGSALQPTALISSADGTANLALQTNGANAVVIDNNQNANFVATGAVTIPNGTTNARPTGVNGMIRYNTTTYALETYVGGSWFTVVDNPQVYSVSYLIVAGGGPSYGTNQGCGGGGAGGVLANSAVLTIGSTYTITVGAGGAANTATNGSNSTAFGVTAFGGGYGGFGSNSVINNGNGGGSGGGGGSSNINASSSGGSGVSGQGYAGGTGNGSSTPTSRAAGGGGGAGSVGSNGTSGGAGGAGGIGVASSITGSSIYYAGGGGGGGKNSGGTGGNGGGGNGGGGNGSSGVNGSANTGGGGGGAYDDNTEIIASKLASGGSGVVILSIPTASYSGTITGSPTVTTSGSNTILKYTSSGTYTA